MLRRRFLMADCAKAIHEVTHVPLRDLRHETRVRHVMIARAAYYRLARRFTDASMVSICKFINKDHTSGIHAMKPKRDLATELQIQSVELLATDALLGRFYREPPKPAKQLEWISLDPTVANSMGL